MYNSASFGKSAGTGRYVSSGKLEGRFLEPSQLKLQATGSTVVERPRDFVRPPQKYEALDFRLTKDTGVVRGIGDISMSTPNIPVSVNPRRAHSGGAEVQPLSTDVDYSISAGYLRMYHHQEGSFSDDVLSDSTNSNISKRPSNRSSSATAMNGSSNTTAAARVAAADPDSADIDKIMIAESSSAPGVPIIYRPAEEKAANPDRLNLDRRRLAVCPILDGEDQLRLLNYQHNHIRKISNLHTLRKLIFLDLYDNQLEEISGLSNLRSLRVLMLGKNRIKKIEHLDNLTKLDVLDLHGNEIQVIENINHLTELRVLNLAGNRISFVDNLIGMISLAELNLRRNQINSLTGVDQLPSLQRLFLSCNELSSFEDIKCLSRSLSLQEISLDGNPIASDQFYKQNILSSMQQIRQLDMKRVTDEEKRISAVMARKEEDRRRELQKISIMKEKRKQAIHTAKQQWEMMQSTLIGKSNRLTKMPEIYASHVATYDNPVDVIDEDTADEQSGLTDSEEYPRSRSDLLNIGGDGLPSTLMSRGARSYNRFPAKTRSLSETRPTNPPNGVRPEIQDKELSLYEKTGRGLIHRGNGLAELDGDTLTCYGPGSVDSLDRNWGVQAAGAVTTIIFKFIEFGDVISKAFNKIRSKFPATHTYDFTANNIHSLHQLNALSQLRRVESLTIREEGNPVTQVYMWKSYLLFRLAHLSIKSLNGQEVTSSDILAAEKMFGCVSQTISECLPSFRLLALLPEPRKKQLLAEEKTKSLSTPSASAEEMKAYGSSETTTRAVLSYSTIDQGLQAQQDYEAKRKMAHDLISSIAKETLATENITTKLNKVWEKSFSQRIQTLCVNMLQNESYPKTKMDNVMMTDQG